MFTMEIIYTDKKGNKKEKYYCHKIGKCRSFSENRDCAFKFKSIGSAKSAFTKYRKKLYMQGFQNLLGYNIEIIR